MDVFDNVSPGRIVSYLSKIELTNHISGKFLCSYSYLLISDHLLLKHELVIEVNIM